MNGRIRRRGCRRIAPRTFGLLVLLVLPLVAPVAGAQQAAAPPRVDEAEPYDEAEFPQWALDLRRAEIVALGALPITLLASRLLYGLGRFTVESIRARQIAPAYLPPFLAPPGAVPLTREDNLWIIGGAVSLSTVVAIIDYARGVREDE